MTENQPATRIILCMIVKNEAKVLRRCLETALPVISAACLCDTGSSDGTRALAESMLTAAGIPSTMPEQPWVNFGANRTQAFVATRELARQLQWDLDSTYALFLDADMLLNVDPSFNADELVEGGYLLLQQDGSIQYDNLRLARLSHDWRSVGVTHEYWTADGVGTLERLPTLTIIHLGDGGAKENKFTRDIQLLEAELGGAQNLRTLFYLARSYEDTGRFQDARRLYEWRAAGGGWDEEAWYAAYRLGMCSIQLDDWDKAVVELLNAWARRPQRAEPLYQLAHAARLRGESHLAMLMAERALRIPLPETERLFVEPTAYNYGPLEEISISAFYTGERERGIAATEVLLHGYDVPPFSRDLAGRNAAFYAQPLPVSWSIPIEFAEDFEASTFSPGNTTISRSDDGYLLIVRLINYEQDGAVWFVSRDADGRIRSKNVHLQLDHDFEIQSSLEIDDSLLARIQPPDSSEANVQGIEDIRLVRWAGDWWFTAVSSAFPPAGYPGVVLGRLDPSATNVEHLTPLSYAGSQLAEKNWLPFIHEDRLLLLYSCGPTVILEPDLATGECVEVHRTMQDANFDRYRGSSAFIVYRDRYLFTVHEVTYVDGKRVYLHRFVEMDQGFRITRVSRLFTIWHLGVEYNCGICLNHAGDALLMTCSFEDRQSWIVHVPLAEVERMLLPVNALTTVGEPALFREGDAETLSAMTRL